jgi:hypothetical protein
MSIDVSGAFFWVSESYWTRGRTPLAEGSARRKDLYQHWAT